MKRIGQRLVRSAGYLPWFLAAVVLVLLFLASSTDLLIREQEREVYPISVIIDDSSDENYVNFRKGIDQAALELHADVNFITMYERQSAAAQRELMLREQEDGAAALIVAPINEQSASELNVSQTIRVPVVFIRGNVVIQNDIGGANLTENYYELGQQLGEAVARRFAPEIPVFYLSTGKLYGAALQYLEGAESVLATAFQRRERLSRSVGETEIRRIRAIEQESAAVLIALDPQSLLKAAKFRGRGEQRSEEESTAEKSAENAGAAAIAGLYGPGTSLSLVSYLEDGTVDGLCITDDFAEGYLAVRMAVERIRKRTSPMESRTLTGHYIEKAELDGGSYEKILYPME